MAKKAEIKEAKVVEATEEKEIKKETKPKKDLALKIIKKCWDIIFWCAIICLVVVWVLDFINVKQEKDPQFCIKKETISTEKGDVDSCLGLGYKIFTYHTSNLDGAREFAPFWSEPRK